MMTSYRVPNSRTVRGNRAALWAGRRMKAVRSRSRNRQKGLHPCRNDAETGETWSRFPRQTRAMQGSRPIRFQGDCHPPLFRTHALIGVNDQFGNKREKRFGQSSLAHLKDTPQSILMQKGTDKIDHLWRKAQEGGARDLPRYAIWEEKDCRQTTNTATYRKSCTQHC